MLVAFRLFLVAAGLVVLALVVTARGLVPEPDVRTRIGEVPSVGRSLVQQAIVPLGMIERQSSGLEGKRAEAPAATSEPSDAADALAPAAAHSASGDEPSSGSETAAAAEPREADLVAVNLTETPSDIADATSGTEQGPDRAATVPAQAAPSESLAAKSAETREPLPVAAPDGTALASAPGAKHDASAAPASPGPPALAFAAEPAAERKTPAGERPGAAPAKAKPDKAAALAHDPSAAIGPDSDAASDAAQTRSSKGASTTKAAKKRKIARSSARKAAAKSERKAVVQPRGKIKVAHRASRRPGRPGRQPAIQQWTTPNGFSATPQTYQYLYTAPVGKNTAPSDATSVQ